MEHFKVVLLILIIFAVFICLNNGGYFDKLNEPFIFEGNEGIDVQDLIECQVLDPPNQSCSGPCLEDENATFSSIGGPWDRQSCTGETGNVLSWLTYSEKRTGNCDTESESTCFPGLENLDIRPSDEIIDYELMIENGDVFKYNGEIYVYRGNDMSYNSGDIIPLIRYELGDGDEKKTEFCLFGDNFNYNPGIVDGETNCTDVAGNYYTPLTENIDSEYDIYDCSGSTTTELKGGEGSEHTHGCFVVGDELLFPNCISEDGTELKPKSWWKPIYENGNTIEQLCSGVIPDPPRKWTGDISTTSAGNQDIADQLPTLLSPMEPVGRTRLNVSELIGGPSDETCSFENTECGAGHHNNSFPHSSTCNAYKINGEDIPNTQSSVRDLRNLGPLSCNVEGGFQRRSENINVGLNCNHGIFRFYGCQPSECTMPDIFEEKYQFKPGITPILPGNTFNVNHIKNIFNHEELNIECKPGFTESENGITMNCINGEVELSGCEQSECIIPDNALYSVPQDTNIPLTETEFYEMNPRDRNVDCGDETGPCFKCNTPDNYYINPSLNSTSSRSQMISLLDEEDGDENNYQLGAKVSCETGQTEFTFEGCYENKCLNPGKRPPHISEGDNLTGYVYDSDIGIKPTNFEDNKTEVTYGSHYDKFTLTEDISNQPESLNRSDIENKIKCGINFTNTDPTSDTLSGDNIKCYSFYDYKTRNKSEDTNVPNFTDPFNEGSVVLNDKEAIKNYLLNSEDIPDKMYFSVEGCQENYCRMPVYNNNDEYKYMNPNHLREEDNSVVLGYLSSGIDQTENTPKTALEYASLDSDNQLRCDTGIITTESSKVCSEEPIYTNEDINTMTANNSLFLEGQEGSILSESSVELHEVGRGGPFQIRRCWDQVPDVEIKATCSGQNCTDTELSECNVEFSGCQQNKCRLKPEDALNGTRILIENSNGSYLSVGGITQDNIGPDMLFNVDQIRNISCDYNYSKEIPNENIVIQCPTHSDFFEIENKCSPTSCEGDEIIDTINLREKGYLLDNNNEIVPREDTGVYSSCANTDYITPRSFLDITTPVDINDNSLKIQPEDCLRDTGVNINESILGKNLARYNKLPGFGPGEQNLNEIECSSNDEGISSVGRAKASCNYTNSVIREDFNFDRDKPKYQLSQCQPQLCRYPSMEVLLENYPSIKYVEGSRANSGQSDSLEMVNNSEYINEIFPEDTPSFVTETSYNQIRSPSVQCDDSNYNGSVEVDCDQQFDNYLSNDEIPLFTNFRGCQENMCIIPVSGADGDAGQAYDALLSDSEKDQWNIIDQKYQLPEELLQGNPLSISSFGENICKPNFRVNDAVSIQCPSIADGTDQEVNENGHRIFKNLIDSDDGNEQSYCIPNVCSLPSVIGEGRMIDEIDTFRLIRDQNYEGYTHENIDIQNFVRGASQKNPLKGYVVDGLTLNEMGSSPSSSDLTNIDCAPNYSRDNPSVSCLEHNTEYEISGCTENYCSFNPEIFDYSLYRFKHPISSLRTLAEEQDGKLTVDQINYNSTSGVSCSSLAEGDPTITCSDNTFSISGCSPKSEPSYNIGCENRYSYYPGDCIENWMDTVIYISSELDENQTRKPISITHKNNGELRPEEEKNQKMHNFMEECKNKCNINEHCFGYTVIKVDEENLERTISEHGSCSSNPDYDTKTTCEEAGETWVSYLDTHGTCSNPEHVTKTTCEQNDEWTPHLKVGTMVCEQKSHGCQKEIVGHDWGIYHSEDDEYGNSQVYTTYTDILSNENIPVLRAELISGNKHRFFEKKFRLEGVDVDHNVCDNRLPQPQGESR